MKTKRIVIFLLGLLAGSTAGADYATWTSGGGNSGTGTFPAATMMPGFSWSVTGNVASVSLASGDPFDLPNTFETAYGDGSSASNINPRALSNAEVCGTPGCYDLGDPISTTVTLTVNFDSPTPTSGWGFAITDIDVDQIRVRATDSSNNPVSVPVIASWFSQTFDANSSSGTNQPSWDPNEAALIASEAAVSTWQTVIVDATQDLESPAGWFAPTMALNSLTFEFQSINQTGRPSFHVYLGAEQGAGAAPPPEPAQPVPGVTGLSALLLVALMPMAVFVSRRLFKR